MSLALEIGTDPALIHEPSVGVVGTKGDSQCYLGVAAKVEAIHQALRSRIGTGPNQLRFRLVQPEFTIATPVTKPQTAIATVSGAMARTPSLYDGLSIGGSNPLNLANRCIVIIMP